MGDLMEELFESIERAMVVLKARPEARYASDVENLKRIKRILQGLDPEEIEALLEDDGEEE